MTIISNPLIYNHLATTYGSHNIYWPLLWSHNGQIKLYTYEINKFCNTNSFSKNFPSSISGIPTHKVNYTLSPRTITPPNPILSPSIGHSYDCSYDYTTKNMQAYTTIDIDYMWDSDKGRRSLELTTFYVQFKDLDIASKVVSTINRRNTWRYGPHAMHAQVQASKDLGGNKYILACVNTISKESPIIDKNGNALWFDLDSNTINSLHKGQLPSNLNFGKFTDFLNSL